MLAISPFAAGAANDIVARIVLDQAGRDLGQPFVLENRPGAGGIVGVAAVVRADPDGYTFLLSSSSMSSAVILHKSLPYDGLRDLDPIAMFGVQPSVLVVAPSKGFKTVSELVAAAKANPGALNFASAGIGSASHIAAERFRLAAGLTVQHVPYRGPVEALADVMTGRIDFYFLPIAPALPLINQGKVLALAVSTPQRAPALPGGRRLRKPAIRMLPICSGAASRPPPKRHGPSSTRCTTWCSRHWTCRRSRRNCSTSASSRCR